MTTVTVPEARRARERHYHEDQCAGERLDMRMSLTKVRWFRCTKCGFQFNEYTEGAAAMVRRSR